MHVCFRKVAVMLHTVLREVCLSYLGQVTGYLYRDFLSFSQCHIISTTDKAMNFFTFVWRPWNL